MISKRRITRQSSYVRRIIMKRGGTIWTNLAEELMRWSNTKSKNEKK